MRFFLLVRLQELYNILCEKLKKGCLTPAPPSGLKKYKDSPIVPWLLGSGACEQLFAWIQTSMYGGRRTNFDADFLARGMEKRNVYNIESDDEDQTAYAHATY